MAVRWTEEQQQAIDLEGKNIIVSAGAGSGKTAVLTERVLRKLKNGVNIDNLLILTFTKAAAHEMKERIRKAIKKVPNLSSQLDKIDGAYITTFDSYALSIVKKYHHILNVSNNISICESSIINLEKEKIINEIFEQLYNENNNKFLKLIGDFCVKDDKEIKDSIISISNKLDLKYDKEEYLLNYVKIRFNNDAIYNDIKTFTNILIEKINSIVFELKNLNMYVESDYYTKTYDALNKLLSSKTIEEIYINMDVKLPSIPRGTDELGKSSKEKISNIVKEIQSLVVYKDEDEIKNSILYTKEYVEIIIDIILKLDKKLNEFKFEKDLYEFNDIAKMAIKILKENPSIALELKNSLNEILIDEYQDTNDLQEDFISMISNNNVYMVGDIKQSIYRFRNANPYIFKNKYDTYTNGELGIKIDLNKNFRSRKEVLDNINIIFNLIMDDLIGGAEYKISHQMIFGNSTYEEEGKTTQNNNIEFYNYEFDKDKGFTKEETEIFIIANDIKNKIDNKYQIFDKDTLEIREAKYSDFVILIDRTTNFDLYKKIFEYMSIPLSVLKDETITNGTEINLIKNILKLLINLKLNNFDEDFKYAFMSIARSYLFNINDDEIFNCISNNKYDDSIILEISNKILSKIDSITISMLLDTIINEFDFYNKIITVGNIKESIIRLEYIVNLSKNLEKMGYNITDFYEYLENISSKNYDIKFSSNSENSDSCKIMTIHKSKGLEYPICYYSSLYSKFNISDLKEKFIFDNTYGIITPYVKEGIKSTIYKSLLKEQYLKEEISEKIRLFYVALTRCKEKMIVINSFNDLDIINNNCLVNNDIRLKYSSFSDIINSIKNEISEYIHNISLEDIHMSKNYNLIKNSNYKSKIPHSNKIITVDELNIESKEVEDKKFSKVLNTIISEEEKEKLEIGSKIHYALEVLDFKNPDFSKLNLNKFYIDKINTFLSNEIFNGFDNTKIIKEHEFIYEIDNIEYHGVIDLILEKDNEIIILDYKLKNIDDEEYIKQLLGYKNFIKEKTNKKISVYLYSLLEETLKNIDNNFELV